MATQVTIATTKARALLTEPVELLPAQTLPLINPLVYSNAGKLDDAAFRRWIHWFNAAREVEQPSVVLGHYGAPAYLDGSGPFAVLTGDTLVEEQAAADRVDLGTTWFNLQQRLPDAHELDRPCLLACRYGEWTWGHWLIDMLPKIVLAERFTPKRFTYVVPGNITQPGSSQFYTKAVLDSLAVYGIDQSRLLRVQAGQVYRFQNLYDIADVSADGLHPGVLAAMRDVPHIPAGPRLKLAAVLRSGAEHRPLANGAAIEAVLRESGATIFNPGAIRSWTRSAFSAKAKPSSATWAATWRLRFTRGPRPGWLRWRRAAGTTVFSPIFLPASAFFRRIFAAFPVPPGRRWVTRRIP
jgi:hypothetical protein